MTEKKTQREILEDRIRKAKEALAEINSKEKKASRKAVTRLKVLGGSAFTKIIAELKPERAEWLITRSVELTDERDRERFEIFLRSHLKPAKEPSGDQQQTATSEAS